MPSNPDIINLSALDVSTGFQINGEVSGDGSGCSVSAAGDVNGDGITDLIIGAFGATPNGSSSGASYVVFGKATGFAATLNLSTLDGTTGFQISGEAASDYSGRSVSSAGDVNGDGFDDFIIGADGADPNGSGSGASYVIFGKATAFDANLNLSALDGTTGFQINGELADDKNGRSVSSAGDVNNDGFDDIIIGSPYADPNGAYSGASYVVFGKAGGFASNLNLSSLDGTNGFQINGETGLDFSGFSVSSAGDVNNDGFDDIIIGSKGAGSSPGASYVIFGKGTAFDATLELSTLNGTTGFQVNGEAGGDRNGASVSSAGDVNGDGFDDLVIGAWGADTNGTRSGASYVIFGKATAFDANFDLSTLDGTNGFQMSGEVLFDYSGFSVSSAGDVNGDGFDDIIVGASKADPNGDRSGASYVVFGKGTAFDATFELSTLNGDNGFQINGVSSFNYSGRSVSSAGDVNGDGFDDIIVGAYGANGNSGASYVIFGRATAAINRMGTALADKLFGGEYDDTFTGLDGNDTITSGSGNDTIEAGTGNDTIDAGTGNDRINGSSGLDVIQGGAGLDLLKGGGGRDTLVGGDDRDVLIGGTQSDRFKFDAGDSGQSLTTVDRILDFEFGAVNVGDRFDYTSALTIGGSSTAATSTRASINQSTGIATFAAGSGNNIGDAMADIHRRFTQGGDSVGEFALFQIQTTGDYYIFVSDGVAGLGADDIVVELDTITSISSISLAGGDLTILT